MYLNGCIVDYVETLEGAASSLRIEREEHLRLADRRLVCKLSL
jgi:hypothetical protein